MPEYKSGNYFWFPPPAAANICIDELRKARHKRQTSTHIFVCPRIMAPSWRRRMHRSADVILSIPPGHPAWPIDMHEPLTIAVVFPYLSRQPWELRKTGLMVEMGGKVQRVLKENPALGFDLLSKLCILTGKMESMSVLRLCRVLRGSRETEVPS